MLTARLHTHTHTDRHMTGCVELDDIKICFNRIIRNCVRRPEYHIIKLNFLEIIH